MQGDKQQVSRRNVVRGATILGGLAVAGGVFLTQSEGAVAATFTIGDAAPETNDTGQLNYVRLEVTHRLEWDGFDTEVERLRYIDRITVRPNDENETAVVNDVTTDPLADWSGDGDSNGWGDAGEYTSGPGNAGYAASDLDYNIVGDPDADDPEDGGPREDEAPAPLLDLMESEEDGETTRSTVRFEREARLLDGGGDEVGRSTVSDDFQVIVTNEASETSASGRGSTYADGDDEEP